MAKMEALEAGLWEVMAGLKRGLSLHYQAIHLVAAVAVKGKMAEALLLVPPAK